MRSQFELLIYSTTMFLLLLCVCPSGMAQLLEPQTLSGSRQEKDELPCRFKAWIDGDSQNESAFLIVAAEIDEGCYIHSLTQPGPSVTKIDVGTNSGFEITGAFRPTKAPQIEGSESSVDRLEKHTKEVEFFLPIKIAAGQNLKDLKINVRINGQCCSDVACMPIKNMILIAKFSDGFLRNGNPHAAEVTRPKSGFR